MVHEVLAALIEELDSCDRTPQEQMRAYRDLRLIRERLATGVYQNGEPFENSFQIPNRNREIAWDLCYLRAIGVGWEALIRGAGVGSCQSALSVCTGSRPKAELGLLFAGFRGLLTCLNRNSRELQELLAFLDLFGVRWPVQQCSGDLFAPPGASYPLVVANHIIDDLCYDQFARTVGLSPYEIYADEQCAALFWERISPGKLVQVIAPRLFDALLAWCEPHGTIILVQYESPFEQMLGLRRCREVCREIMQAIPQQLAGTLRRLPVPALPDPGPIRIEDCCILQRLRSG